MLQLQRDLVTDCVQFLKTIKRYLRECEEPCREVVPESNRTIEQEEDDRTYLNVFQGNHVPDGDRNLLITQCEALLERFEKSPSLVSLLQEDEANGTVETQQELEDDEESSYLDMSGTNPLKPNTSSSSSSVSIGDTKAQRDAIHERDEPNDDEMLFDTTREENSYDLTTDQILYDECQQEVSYELEQGPSATVRSPTPEIALHESQCPFGGLPASHLRLQQSPKHGTLFKQEKRLFFDQFKKYYVGLIGKWLLVYNSHNDLKPWQTIFIKSIKLDLSLNEQINEKHLFQIITHTDSKVHFLSPSFQDLNEWIVAIENNLIEKVERAEECGGVVQQVPRKLPLPPCPKVPTDSDETDLHVTSHVEDGIYEEPSLCLKTESDAKSKLHGYDTPKPCCTGSDQLNAGCSSSPNNRKPDLPAKTSDTGGASTPTPVKSWLKNRFNRSPPDPSDVKLSKKALKKLSFEELSLAEGSGDRKSPTKQIPVPSSPKFSLSTTPTSKGTKINMIISQLEANGQLNLLSKRLTETNKRYTWVADGVAS